MDKFRLVLEKIRTCIEMQNGATGSQLKVIWNDLSEAITQSEESKAITGFAKAKCPKTIVIAPGGLGAAMARVLQEMPNAIVLSTLPEAEPFIINRLPDIEQPPMISIKELEEPFYKRFDRRRGKRKNRR